MDREYKTRIERLFAEFGVADYHFENGGKHPRVVARAGGNNISYTFPASGSDRRGVLNCLADLKRLLGLRLEPKLNDAGHRPRHPRQVKQPHRPSMAMSMPVASVSKPTWQEMLATIVPSLSTSS